MQVKQALVSKTSKLVIQTVTCTVMMSKIHQINQIQATHVHYQYAEQCSFHSHNTQILVTTKCPIISITATATNGFSLKCCAC